MVVNYVQKLDFFCSIVKFKKYSFLLAMEKKKKLSLLRVVEEVRVQIGFNIRYS